VCPGSRSTPLALAAAAQSSLKVWSVVDERTAAFFALGLALETGQPAAVLATSGTAGAHFLPAVMEAAASHVPLVLLTADRPWELHGFGAAQTAPQEHLYSDFVRRFEGLSAPLASDAAFLHLRSVVARAVAEAQGPNRGPVHLNAPFREPLAPPSSTSDALPLEGLSTLALSGRPDGAPYTSWPRGAKGFALDEELARVAQLVADTPRGVVVLGPRVPSDGFSAAVLELARAAGYPVLAEACSNVRWSQVPGQVVGQYDLLLREPGFAEALKPSLILRFGGGLTSKRLGEWLDASGAPSVLFAEDGEPVDPSHRSVVVLRGDATATARALSKRVTRPGPPTYAAAFAEAQGLVERALQGAFESPSVLSEPWLASEVVKALPEGADLFVASSMPVRDVDAFALPGRRALRTFSNRGLNGIDGTLSSALGVAASGGRPTVALVGDLAFLHDLNGLLIARRHQVPLTVVVVNNDGGGIFSFLPVAERVPAETFETLFGTPHGLDFEHAAALMGARYLAPTSPRELRVALREAVGHGLSVVEVKVDRHANVPAHEALYARVVGALGERTWR
jgi:2-succinyl-5-enolpyruvyl-6-hydroxy-3-cyclohexene-1-carboxylate synthase